MDPALVTSLTPFGAAGLIAWLWLTERRSGAERERQLSEAHAHLSRQQIELSLLVDVVRENTRALTSLEAALRQPTRTAPTPFAPLTPAATSHLPDSRPADPL